MIYIIAVGKMKEKFFRDAYDNYVKMISRFDKVELIELKDENTDDERIARRKEGERILEKIPKKAYVITTEIEGKMLTSEQFAAKISDIYTYNSPDICFIIGGSCGLDESVKQRSDFALSFSKMTFAHQMFRVFLAEQIYRAFKINNNEAYHK